MDLQNLTQIGIFGLKIYHLASLFHARLLMSFGDAMV
jgi:hypothetical protein